MKIYSATLVGVTPVPVEIEIDLSPGLPFFQIVGLPDAILKESKTRVKSAVIQAGFDFPYDRRLVMNLSPSKIKKEGSGFELALAARILASSGQIQKCDKKMMFIGELALDGSVRSVDEISALAFASDQVVGLELLVVPRQDVLRVSKHVSCKVLGVGHLKDLLKPKWWEAVAQSEEPIEGDPKEHLPGVRTLDSSAPKSFVSSFENVKLTSFWAKHLKIAAVGKHHYLLCGPPGSGKTFFSDTLRLVHSSLTQKKDWAQKVLDALFLRGENELPWAAPHHSGTAVGLLGGGLSPKPGALTRAHGGILFLDELSEFSPSVLDSLREPLEKKCVEIYRAGSSVVFPADVQMVAATNPCRCGYWGHPLKNCVCHAGQRQLYQNKISGPFFDRFDIRIFCPPPFGNEPTETLSQILGVVEEALAFKNKLEIEGLLSRQFDGVPMTLDAQSYLEEVIFRKLQNRRRQIKLLSIAHTLALLQGEAEVEVTHLREAYDLQELPKL